MEPTPIHDGLLYDTKLAEIQSARASSRWWVETWPLMVMFAAVVGLLIMLGAQS